MTLPLVIVAAALAAAAGPAPLPEGTVRWQATLGGAPVGAATLAVRCAGEVCTARYEALLALPAEAGGGTRRTEVEVEVDREGRYRGGTLRASAAAPGARAGPLAGAVPACLAEVLLAAAAPPDGGEACLDFFDEAAPARRRACARRDGEEVLLDLGGLAARAAPGPDGFPREVRVGPFRWTVAADPRPPVEAPRLAGTRVPGPADPARARRFCGVALDGPHPGGGAAAGLPPPAAEGESCRERTRAYLAEARRRGREGRTAVGVAWDGRSFVWHAWAEVRAGDGWLPVDPSFGEAPARGPRFTLGRFGDGPGEAAAREAAGARILACWGAARVE